jgi:NAD(P)-dependent dehydrogenase (short-subunit alcohol dehydrogenase family)/acyl carrier protein
MPDDIIDPVKSTILGPSKLIAVENGNIRCKTIDIPFPFSDKGETGALLQLILNELFYQYEENVVAYRYRQRWVPAYSQLAQHPQLRSGVTVRKGATYIVVGGMGGMGLSITSDLVQHYQAEIIIVHRSPFPERAEWPEWIMQKGENNDTVKRILKLQELERQGGKLKLYQVNVAVEDEVQRFINTISANDTQIAGLIWAAGEVDYGGIILNRSEADFTSYISSKVHGLIFFEKYLNFQKLEFLALFSSMGNVFYQVKFGQVAYNAANEFLNNYALYARKHFQIHAFAINWCDWMDVGMTVRSLMEQKHISDVRQVNKEINLGLTPKEGVSLFHTCLGTRLPAYYIYKGNITEQVKQYKVQLDQSRIAFDTIKETKAENDVPQNTQSALIKLYADFFGKPSITLMDDFFELGGDSLKAMILIGRINQQMGSHLTIADMYRYTTVAQMADKLELTADRALIPSENSLQYQWLIGDKMYYELGESQGYWLNDACESSYKNHEKNHGLLVVNYKITGDIDPVVLGQAVEFILQRHECLRSTFHWINEKAWMRVENEYVLSDIYNYRDATDEKASFVTDQELQDYVYFVNDVMDISQTSPLRVRLTKTGMRKYVLTVKIHHVTSDAWSNNILFRDLQAAYKAFVQKQQPQLPELKWQYKDIMRFELEYVQKNASADKAYWANQFPNYYKPVLLPIPKIDHKANDFKVRRNESFTMPAKITSALKSISNKQGVSFFVTLQASFKFFLFYTTRQPEQGIGTYVYGRSLEADHLLGNYARLAFVRTQFEENDSFLTALEKVNKANEDMRLHKAYPLHLYMSEKLTAGKSIFDDFLQCALQFATDTNFYLNNSVFDAGWEISQMPNHGEVHMQSEMELTFFLQEAENKLQLLVMYNDTGYQLKNMEDFIASYILFLEEVTDQPAAGILGLMHQDQMSIELPAPL